MKISKNQLKHIIREALAQEGVGSWLKDKFSKKRKPLPGEDTTPLDMSGLGKYNQQGPGIFSGELGTGMWNRMQKDQDLAAIAAAGDIGEKPEGDISSVAADIPDDPLVPTGTAGLDQDEIQDLIATGYGPSLMRTAAKERGPGPKPEPGLKLSTGRGSALTREPGLKGRRPQVVRTTTPKTTSKTAPKAAPKEEEPNPWLAAPEVEPKAPAAAASSTDYKIKPRDTLGKIAKENGVSLAAMLKANPQLKDRTGNTIRAGDNLKIPSRVNENKIFDRWKELIK